MARQALYERMESANHTIGTVVSDEHLRILKYCTEVTNLNRSELVRRGIDLLYEHVLKEQGQAPETDGSAVEQPVIKEGSLIPAYKLNFCQGLPEGMKDERWVMIPERVWEQMRENQGFGQAK